MAGPNDSAYRRAGTRVATEPAARPDEAILEMKDLGEKIFYGGWPAPLSGPPQRSASRARFGGPYSARARVSKAETMRRTASENSGSISFCRMRERNAKST